METNPQELAGKIYETFGYGSSVEYDCNIKAGLVISGIDGDDCLWFGKKDQWRQSYDYQQFHEQFGFYPWTK